MADMNEQVEHGIEIVITTLLGKIPVVGEFVAALVEILWPNNQPDVWSQVKDQVEQLVDQKIADSDYARVQAVLGDASQGTGLIGVLASYLQIVNEKPLNKRKASDAWIAANEIFIDQSGAFEQSGIEVLLLPLFAQMANLHLALLRDGMAHQLPEVTDIASHIKKIRRLGRHLVGTGDHRCQ